MENFIKADVTSYVKQEIENGTLIPRQAEKFSRITARQGNAGETVISSSVDAEGKEIQEKVAQVSVDEKN